MIFESSSISSATYLWGYGITFALSIMLTLLLVKTISKENWLTYLLNKLPISTGKSVSPFGGIPGILSFFAADGRVKIAVFLVIFSKYFPV